jgi:muramidase (phage lysozyme)
VNALALQLRDTLAGSANLRAFLRMLRVGEGTTDEDGYRRHFGGELADSLADHPRKVVTKKLGGKSISSSAFGAYQFLTRTWDGCKAALDLPDMSPASQDVAAVYLIRGRKALPDVLAGRIEQAIIKCNKEWASLPGSPYGQPVKTMAQALEYFASYLAQEGAGATETPAPVPVPQPLPEVAPTPQPRRSDPIPIDPINAPQGEPNMVSPALIPFALEALKVVVPKLGELFAGSDTAKRNVQAAATVIDVATQAIGARNAQEMVETIQADKEAAATVKQAIEQNWYELTDLLIKAGEADEKTRAAALDRNAQLAQLTGGRWLYLLGGVCLLVILCSYVITGVVILGDRDIFSDETKAMLLGQVVIFGFVTVLGFLLGSNIQNRIAANASRSKDE